VELVEMERTRENAWCCGAGGGLRTFDTEFARWAAEQRVEEALSTGAEALVTSCPWCEQNLGEAAAGRIAVYNIPELLFRSLEEEKGEEK
jgi:Fe-S oxidoreductase